MMVQVGHSTECISALQHCELCYHVDILILITHWQVNMTPDPT